MYVMQIVEKAKLQRKRAEMFVNFAIPAMLDTPAPQPKSRLQSQLPCIRNQAAQEPD